MMMVVRQHTLRPGAPPPWCSQACWPLRAPPSVTMLLLCQGTALADAASKCFQQARAATRVGSRRDPSWKLRGHRAKPAWRVGPSLLCSLYLCVARMQAVAHNVLKAAGAELSGRAESKGGPGGWRSSGACAPACQSWAGGKRPGTSLRRGALRGLAVPLPGWRRAGRDALEGRALEQGWLALCFVL
jgi:hypothetical protein